MRPRNWKVIWDAQREARNWALRVLVPGTWDCAIALSRTFQIETNRPANEEANLRVPTDPPILVACARNDSSIPRYYVRAAELAKRLEREWGTPALRLSAKDAVLKMKGRYGVVFFEDAYKYGIDHIDIYNGKIISYYYLTDQRTLHLAGNSSPFKTAKKIWFWEIIDR